MRTDGTATRIEFQDLGRRPAEHGITGLATRRPVLESAVSSERDLARPLLSGPPDAIDIDARGDHLAAIGPTAPGDLPAASFRRALEQGSGPAPGPPGTSEGARCSAITQSLKAVYPPTVSQLAVTSCAMATLGPSHEDPARRHIPSLSSLAPSSSPSRWRRVRSNRPGVPAGSMSTTQPRSPVPVSPDCRSQCRGCHGTG